MTMASRVAASLSAKAPPVLLTPIASVLVSIRQREPCLVRVDESGGLAHRYAAGTVVQQRLGGPSARQQDRAARDHFLFGYVPGPGETVFDVGAGVGSEVRVFSRLVGATGRVVSVEAHPATYRYLVRTVELNRLANVTTVQCALTGTSGQVLLENDLDNYISNRLTSDESTGVLVPGRTLDELMDSCRVESIDLLKMNIEGAEHDALCAARTSLARVRNIVVSCHDFKAVGPHTEWMRTFGPVNALLEDVGFHTWTREPERTRPWIAFYVYGAR